MPVQNPQHLQVPNPVAVTPHRHDFYPFEMSSKIVTLELENIPEIPSELVFRMIEHVLRVQRCGQRTDRPRVTLSAIKDIPQGMARFA